MDNPEKLARLGIIDYMSNIAGVLQEAGTACPLRAPGFTLGILVVVHVARVFSFLCCVFVLFVFGYVLFL
jgi:hypothetical protein